MQKQEEETFNTFVGQWPISIRGAQKIHVLILACSQKLYQCIIEYPVRQRICEGHVWYTLLRLLYGESRENPC